MEGGEKGAEIEEVRGERCEWSFWSKGIFV